MFGSLLKGGQPKPPPAPDPVTIANAQGASNQETARLQAQLNRVDSNGPYGSVTYNQSSPDHWTQTTNLSEAQQHILDQTQAAQAGALGVAGRQLDRVDGVLNQGLPVGPTTGLASTPTAGNVGGGAHFDPAQTSFDPGQKVQGDIGPDDFQQAIQSTRNAVYNQATSRLDPQWNRAAEGEQAQLTAQGLNSNDTAWKNAMDQFNEHKTDAYNQANYSAVGAGNDLQAQLFGQQAEQGSFHNQAAAQQYGQGQGQAAFYNTATGDNQQRGMARTQQDNAAEAQRFSEGIQAGQFQNQAQGQAFQQGAYAQELPINEFNALLSSGQVSMPQGVQYTPTSVAPTDVTGAYALSSQAANARYAAQMQNYGSGINGLFNLGAAAMKFAA